GPKGRFVTAVATIAIGTASAIIMEMPWDVFDQLADRIPPPAMDSAMAVTRTRITMPSDRPDSQVPANTPMRNSAAMTSRMETDIIAAAASLTDRLSNRRPR